MEIKRNDRPETGVPIHGVKCTGKLEIGVSGWNRKSVNFAVSVVEWPG
jgi:hypothetical protein